MLEMKINVHNLCNLINDVLPYNIKPDDIDWSRVKQNYTLYVMESGILNDNQLYVLNMKYGIFKVKDDHTETLNFIATSMTISIERVRQILTKAKHIIGTYEIISKFMKVKKKSYDIYDINFSKRVHNALINAGFKDLTELLDYDINKLMTIKGIFLTGAIEIISKLKLVDPNYKDGI